MRIVKNSVVRKNEILDVAEKLFCADGYDNTSTNDILSELSIARGTLYYYLAMSCNKVVNNFDVCQKRTML